MGSHLHRTAADFAIAYDKFEAYLTAMRSSPPLTMEAVEKALALNGSDAAKARASLASRTARQDPHKRGIKSDAHITGQVGGRSSKRPDQTIWGEGARGKKTAEQAPQLLAPMERSIRPANARGETTFYLNLEQVTKARTSAAAPSESTQADGSTKRPANAAQHVVYIERDEALPKNGLPESTSRTAAAAPDYARYQGRTEAVAADVSGEGSILTNLPGGTEAHVDFFRKVEAVEFVGNETMLTITDAGEGSVGRTFLERARGDALFAALVAAKSSGDTLDVPPGLQRPALKLLEEIGWTPKNSTQKRKGARKLSDRKAREERAEERRTSGVHFKPGRSGRIQGRLVGELPHEISPSARLEICKGIVSEFQRRGVPYVLALHAPNYANDARNWHFHLIWYERPAKRFTGREDHLKNVGKRYENIAKAALADPEVQKCKGMWDFEVPYTYRDKSNRVRTVYPFRQNKDRYFRHKWFIPSLRELMADLTNDQLERARCPRRVFEGSMENNGIDKARGEKLGDKQHSQELAGIPTEAGTRNEQKQWDYLMLQLERRHAEERAGVAEEWDALLAKANPGDLCDPQTLIRHRADWMRNRHEELAIRHQVRRAHEIGARALSRPERMLDSAYNHLEAALSPDAPAKIRRQASKYLSTVETVTEHTAALQQLFRDEFQLSLRAEALADERAAECRATLVAAGLIKEPAFELAPELVDDVKPARSPKAEVEDRTAANAPLARAPEKSRAEVPVVPPERVRPAEPTKTSVGSAPAVTRAPPPQSPPVAAPKPPSTSGPTAPASSPPGIAAAAQALIDELSLGRRRLVSEGDVVVPRTSTEREREIIRSEAYRRASRKLEQTRAAVDERITRLCEFIELYPTAVQSGGFMGRQPIGAQLKCNDPSMVSDFRLFSEEPEVAEAINRAREGRQRREAERLAKRQAAPAPAPRRDWEERRRQHETVKRNGELLDRIAKDAIPFALEEDAKGLRATFAAEVQRRFGVPEYAVFTTNHHRSRIEGLDRRQQERSENSENTAHAEPTPRVARQSDAGSADGVLASAPSELTRAAVAAPVRTRAKEEVAREERQQEPASRPASALIPPPEPQNESDPTAEEKKRIAEELAERRRLWEPDPPWRTEYKAHVAEVAAKSRAADAPLSAAPAEQPTPDTADESRKTDATKSPQQAGVSDDPLGSSADNCERERPDFGEEAPERPQAKPSTPAAKKPREEAEERQRQRAARAAFLAQQQGRGF